MAKIKGGELPLAAMDRILRKAGAGRVSEGAKKALRAIVEDFAEEIAARAVRLAGHGGRKTIKEEDIRLAAKQ